jgi:acyl-coenzyme A synthetase/AMP-(fatty) acid ligase
MNGKNFSFKNLKIHNLTATSIGQHNNLITPGSWLVHSGMMRSEVPTLLQSCLSGEVNILFGNFTNKATESNLIRELEILHPGEFGLMGFLTSGSTGKQKLVVHKIEKLIESAQSLLESYPEVEGRTTYSAFPSCYMAGILNNFLVPLVGNCPIVLDNSFDFSTPFRISRVLREYNVGWAWMSPGMLKTLISSKKNYLEGHTLKLILSATGPLGDIFRSDLASLLQVPILNTYGLTEVLFVSGEKEMKPQVTLGKPFAGVRMSLSKTSQIQIESNTVPSCIYLLEASGSLQAITENKREFFLTSDIAIKQGDELRLLGRVDDIVVLRGVNVSLSEIESTAQSCDGVVATCARQIETKAGVGIELLVELDEKGIVNLGNIRRHLLMHLPLDRIPNTITIAKLPRLDSGKIDRNKIRGCG